MNAWILSIVGIICLGILLDIVLPTGQMSKYVKGFFSLLCMFVIIAPIPAFLTGEWTISIDTKLFDVDKNLQKDIKILQEDALIDEIQDYLSKSDYLVSVTIKLNESILREFESIDISCYMNITESEVESHVVKIKELITTKYSIEKEDINVLIFAERGG